MRSVPLAPPGPGEVQVRVSACSVCLTEVHFTDGYYDELDAPARLGHEYCGVVAAAGPAVTSLAEGSLVAGFDAFGGFGEVVTAAAERFVPLQAGLPADRGCLLEPVSCCVYAVRRGAVPAGATVLVTGAGSNGLMIAAVARKAGAGRVIVSEPDARRRGLALALGADEALDPADGPLTEALRDEVISVAFESAGSPAALAGLPGRGGRRRPGGHVRRAPGHRDATAAALRLSFPEPVPDRQLRRRPRGRRAGRRAAPELDLESLISHRFGLDEITAAFEAARSAAGLKVIVYPDRPATTG